MTLSCNDLGSFSFDQFPDFLKESLSRKGISTFTEIQNKVIPLALTKVPFAVALAPTGSGKTLSYLLPLLVHLFNQPKESALIVLPTRDLAIQVYNVLSDYRFKGLSCGLLIGGRSTLKDRQKFYNRGPRCLVGTPGRLVANIQNLRSMNINYLVFDEVDRLLDVGFKKEYDAIVNVCSSSKKLFFSATLSVALRQKLNLDPQPPVIVDITSPLHQKKSIEETFIKVEGGEKFNQLLRLISDSNIKSALVFVNTKAQSRFLVKKLESKK